ncbi:acyl-CoA dehydrogenase family protein [Saccharothrix variisporea]|uniref:Alkylation response protein AidB-like acyl-CoA dehydrogenase n=1 Tax=Saccharothrix variisporea TaxID=543527 RepID=A0A495XT19_9PSEU|nr:acyl-CoA dehydrogenase family protein [Saccharothrix variisporea]RKT74808.1 alkylation response protein AidB-like acyl-CoA dehydrogenase [Saccharothrix variisporea]
MTTTAAVDRVLHAVRDVAPRLRENGAEADDRGRLPQESLDLLDKAGVFAAVVPRRFGGLDLTAPEQCAVLNEVARACPATGWTAMVYLSNTWAATLFGAQAQEEVFAAGSVRVSGVYTPSGTLTPVEGGYRLDGRWRFNSGCRDAHWNVVTAVVAGTPDAALALVPMAELGVVDDWDASAAAGTGSCSTTAQDVFVPAHRVVAFGDALASAVPGRPAAPGRDYGLISLAVTQCAAVAVGAGRGALEVFLERLPGRGIVYTRWTEQAETPLTHVLVAGAEARLAAAWSLVTSRADRLQEHADAGRSAEAGERAQVRAHGAFAIQLAREAVEALFDASGASALLKDAPIQRFQRDLRAFSLHGLLLLSTNLEVHGRVLVGLDAGTAIL